jgi:hypothetical protein
MAVEALVPLVHDGIQKSALSGVQDEFSSASGQHYSA